MALAASLIDGKMVVSLFRESYTFRDTLETPASSGLAQPFFATDILAFVSSECLLPCFAADILAFASSECLKPIKEPATSNKGRPRKIKKFTN